MKQKAPLIVQYQELLQRLLKLRLKPTPSWERNNARSPKICVLALTPFQFSIGKQQHVYEPRHSLWNR